MDHSAHGSMKNAASCETWCELQDTLSTDFSNAHCGLGYCSGPRLSEGRIYACRRGSFSYVVASRALGVPVDPSLACSTGPEASRIGRSRVWLADIAKPLTRACGFQTRSRWTPRSTPSVEPNLSTSDQARRPAEFKHINKRRKRNQPGFPE